MQLQLHRRRGAAMAQRVEIGVHELTTDVAVAEGGDDLGPSPHDLYDAALGACKALTVVWYAKRRGIPLDDVHTVVQRDASDERKGVYRLTARLQLSGELTPAELAELAAVAEKCPVHKLMTQIRTEVTTQVELM
jgi:putative redox protein